MPLPVKSVVGSFCGTIGALGMMVCPRALKNSRYFVRISLIVICIKVTCLSHLCNRAKGTMLSKMKYNIHTLHNGLRVVLAPMPDTTTATVVVMSGTGSRYENAHENGLAHFLEHMFFKGTKKRPTARAISEELDATGSVYNAFTSKDKTAYYAKVSARYLDTALDGISDIFLNSTLPP